MSEHPAWFVGNRDPSITETITSDTVAVDLNGKTVRFKAREVGSTTLLVDQPATIVTPPGTDGKVRYDWQAADIAANGALGKERRLLVWWEVTSGGKTQDMMEAIVEVRAHGPETSAYAELEEFKSTAQLTGQSYADLDIQSALAAASRGIDSALGQRFYADADAAQVRYYTAREDDPTVRIDPLVTLTSVQIDPDDNGVFDYTLAVNTDFVLEPVNAVADGKPYTALRLLTASAYTWPVYANRVKVTGKFGWPAIPEEVKLLTILVAQRLVKRTREAPFGIIAFGMDGAAVRASQIASDPEYAYLAAGLSRRKVVV